VSNTFATPERFPDSDGGLPPFLASPTPGTHAVQFYDEENFLIDTVGSFLSAGLAAGERLVVIATRPHIDAFLLKADPHHLERARDEGRLTLLDGRRTLSQLMVGDMPDPQRFRDWLSAIIDSDPPGSSPARVRAYGEMVDLLARDGNVAAAVRLEELWHAVLQENTFTLLCAYLMNNFVRQGDSDRLLQVFANHTHVIPTERFVRLTNSDQRLREVARLQHRGQALDSEIDRRRRLEHALDGALGDLAYVEKQLLIALEREQGARRRAESSDAFKERFLGILGHELLNPLNTILTTVRMMARRQELGAENEGRLDRVVASGVRMQRMIDQLLDIAQSRLPEGIAIGPHEARDLAPLVTKVVGEIGASSPSRTVEVAASPCVVRVDVNRFEQAVWSLLSYSVAHSDPAHHIGVELSPRDGAACLAIHTPGRPTDTVPLPVLLDSFQLDEQTEVRMDGLALGLYLAKRIVLAHGGRIGVRISPERGTTLETILPLA